MMSFIKSALTKTCQIAALSNGFTSKLVIGHNAFSPIQRLAPFATSSSLENAQLALPKKPLTAFFLFRNDVYEKTKKENPGASVAEIGAMLGLKWSELDDGKKETYRTRSTNAREEYKAKMATIAADPKFSLQLDQAKLAKTKKMADKAYKKALREKRALVADLGKPKKKVPSAYTAFYTEKFPRLHKVGDPVPAAAKAIGEAWKALTPEQKQPYVDTFEKAKAEHDAAVLAWKEKQNMDDVESIEAVNKKLNRKRKLIKKKAEAEA